MAAAVSPISRIVFSDAVATGTTLTITIPVGTTYKFKSISVVSSNDATTVAVGINAVNIIPATICTIGLRTLATGLTSPTVTTSLTVTVAGVGGNINGGYIDLIPASGSLVLASAVA